MRLNHMELAMGLEPMTKSLNVPAHSFPTNGGPGPSPRVMGGPTRSEDTNPHALEPHGAGDGTRTHDLPLTRRLLWPN